MEGILIFGRKTFLEGRLNFGRKTKFLEGRLIFGRKTNFWAYFWKLDFIFETLILEGSFLVLL